MVCLFNIKKFLHIFDKISKDPDTVRSHLITVRILRIWIRIRDCDKHQKREGKITERYILQF